MILPETFKKRLLLILNIVKINKGNDVNKYEKKTTFLFFLKKKSKGKKLKIKIMKKLNLLEINPFLGKKLIIDFLKKRISFILGFLKIFLYSSNSPTEFIIKHLKFVFELRAIAELITALS